MEDVLDGILDYLDTEGNLETALLEIEAARGVTIDRWGILVRYNSMDFDQIKIEILPDFTSPEYGNTDTNPIIGDHFNYNHVDIFITVTGMDTLAINNLLLRYAEAFQKLIRADETFNDKFNWVKLLKTDYSPMVKEETTSKLIKICTVSLQVRD